MTLRRRLWGNFSYVEWGKHFGQDGGYIFGGREVSYREELSSRRGDHPNDFQWPGNHQWKGNRRVIRKITVGEILMV